MTTSASSRVTPGMLTRYRVMAFITGVLLVIVFLGMLRYIPALATPESWDPFFLILAQVHGFIYIVYVVVVTQLWMAAKWGYKRLATLFLGGVIPLLSFFVERRVVRELGSVSHDDAVEPSTADQRGQA